MKSKTWLRLVVNGNHIWARTCLVLTRMLTAQIGYITHDQYRYLRANQMRQPVDSTEETQRLGAFNFRHSARSELNPKSMALFHNRLPVDFNIL